jgi:hypothetical protein
VGGRRCHDVGTREQTSGPSANVGLVRSIYAAWEHGEFSSADWADPEVEYLRVSPYGIERTLKGLEAVRSAIDLLDGYRMEADEFRELDGERVLVLDRRAGRGKTGGTELTWLRGDGAHLFHIRGGAVTRLVAYSDRARALADLGLAAQPNWVDPRD